MCVCVCVTHSADWRLDWSQPGHKSHRRSSKDLRESSGSTHNINSQFPLSSRAHLSISLFILPPSVLSSCAQAQRIRLDLRTHCMRRSLRTAPVRCRRREIATSRLCGCCSVLSEWFCWLVPISCTV